jgi:hypothetical protein
MNSSPAKIQPCDRLAESSNWKRLRKRKKTTFKLMCSGAKEDAPRAPHKEHGKTYPKKKVKLQYLARALVLL